MSEVQYVHNVGAVIRGLLNGVKHTSQTIGPVIGVEPGVLENVISGRLTLTKEVENALVSFPGINRRDLYSKRHQYLFPVVDDTDDGVVIFQARDTFNSRRTLTRGPDDVPYYIYADTAMSNISTFRPEWIKELYVHDGVNADELPDWAFNKGHFEHQVTYFIGPVNFYWIDKSGKRRVCRMNTGDTNYITPFVPHTFTTRKEGEGLILAVTYGGAISNPEFRSRILSLKIDDYLQSVRNMLPDLLSLSDKDILGGVCILKYPSLEPSKNSVELIHPVCQPNTGVRELTVYDDANPALEQVDGDRWGYNIGDSDIEFGWKDRRVALAPGDSFFIKPDVSHTFAGAAYGRKEKVLIVDIKPQSGDPYAELALIEKYAGEEGLRRVHTETTRWY